MPVTTGTRDEPHQVAIDLRPVECRDSQQRANKQPKGDRQEEHRQELSQTAKTPRIHPPRVFPFKIGADHPECQQDAIHPGQAHCHCKKAV